MIYFKTYDSGGQYSLVSNLPQEICGKMLIRRRLTHQMLENISINIIRFGKIKKKLWYLVNTRILAKSAKMQKMNNRFKFALEQLRVSTMI